MTQATKCLCVSFVVFDHLISKENFANLRTMLKETREKISQYRTDEAGAEDDTDKEKEDLPQTLTKSDTGVISMLTGDFLAPYLLSSVDRGEGMMKALAGTPIDYLTWGNHVRFAHVFGQSARF